MQYKLWALCEEWKEIFGMERANGVVAKDIMQVVKYLHSQDISHGGVHDETPFEVDPNVPEPVVDMDVTSEAPTIDKIHVTKLTGKKRPAGELHGADKICDVIGQFGKSSDVRIDNLVRAIGYDFDVGKMRNEVFSILDGMDDINEDEKVDVAHWFGKNDNCLEVFMGMTDSGRARYVRRLLSGQLN
ncbi:hypothetical protein ACS0TY_035147 [Phlomoides rotata]